MMSPLSQLNRTFSSASNEAVMNGIIDMNDFNFVIWMLLDESTVDETFSHEEQTKVMNYIDHRWGIYCFRIRNWLGSGRKRRCYR